MEEVLEALTTAQPGESVALSESPQRLGALLTVDESGFVMDGDRLYYALTLVNDTESLTLEFPRVRVTFYDAQGEVVASDESVRMALCPGQELAWASDIWNIEEAPVSMEAELVAAALARFYRRLSPVRASGSALRRHRAGGRGGDARLRTLQPQRF